MSSAASSTTNTSPTPNSRPIVVCQDGALDQTGRGDADEYQDSHT
jgi:hypothetical protein